MTFCVLLTALAVFGGLIPAFFALAPESPSLLQGTAIPDSSAPSEFYAEGFAENAAMELVLPEESSASRNPSGLSARADAPRLELSQSPFAPALLPPVDQTVLKPSVAAIRAAVGASAEESVEAAERASVSEVPEKQAETSPEVALAPAASTASTKPAAETVAETAAETTASDADRPSRYGTDSTKPFDPVKENGEIFVGWEKPTVTLALTGRLNGYMEPCGCAGMDRMMGGISRQYEFFQELKEKGWKPLILDVGGISPGVTKQAQLKFLATVNMLREMEYDAITLGTIDLNFPCADILAEVSNPGKAGQLFTSANVGLFEFDNKLLPPAKIVSRNGVKIGIVGVLGDEEQKTVQNDEVVFRPARLVLAQLVPLLKKQCQFLILLSHASAEESKAYAREFPDIDIVVTPDGTPVPPAAPEIIPETGQYFITMGEKGMNVIVLGLFDDDSMPLRYQRVPMDSRFKSSPKILDLMQMYQKQLELEGLEGLGIRPLKNPLMKTNGLYVGSKRCESCHEESYKIWKKSRHAIAWKSLETSKPPRTFDPECIACHVVGWNAEHRLPYQSGYLNGEETPQLRSIGCESCHGPGSLHMNAEVGSNEALQKKYRKAVHLEANLVKGICITCHDLDNSPKFNFDRYYKCIEHHETPKEEEGDYYEE